MIAAPQPPIEEIVRAIVQAVHPRRVVLFGSRARGDARADSDVDVMVELDAAPDARAIEARIRDLCLHLPWEVDARVYDSANVGAMRDQPGHLLYAIMREGRELYAQPGVARTRPATIREPDAARRFIQAWLERADEDLEAIRLMLAPDRVPWGPVCFHAQQAAEKYLKALLIQRGQHPDRTHDLRQLLESSRQLGYALAGIHDDCVLLSNYAVEARYPDERMSRPGPTPPEGQAAVAACHRIVAAARQHLSDRAS